MQIIEWIVIGLLLFLVTIVLLIARRAVYARAGGTIRCDLRVSTMLVGRGWSPGFARFVGDELRWYRLFSIALRPKRVLTRSGLAVESRRLPEGQERLIMPADWIILRCVGHQAPVEIAMALSTVTGFSSWIEAGPPDYQSPRLSMPPAA
ncbi:hypothetical protein Ais01nite_22610 [Asanoa ishikariensis]|uniref:DUF2550 domain-containing protein n=1 Tax=Asanoa ishikariensis TaxID=137265 RepID=A0A1H3RBJ4_9ACTN|nr:DUF2550 domain-containing protein [Asanoa ishikariensis]GIF64226.1 hypothetical protein Ais01nite_22610 [Asanoa ishikariensis]SDZ22631.1 Protein of unknown function [Asanoa ishikariensis]